MSGCGQTVVVNVDSDSTGAALYQEVQRRSGIPASLQVLVQGSRVIRHRLSLGKQAIRHLSTIFVLTLGSGGGKERLGNLRGDRGRDVERRREEGRAEVREGRRGCAGGEHLTLCNALVKSVYNALVKSVKV